MQKIRVIYIVNGGHYSGSAMALENLIIHLEDKIKCAVVSPNKGDFTYNLAKRGIKCYYVNFRMNCWPEKWNRGLKWPAKFVYVRWINFLATRKLKIITREFKPDIIHTNNGPVDIGYKVCKKLNIKHVWHLREFIDLGLKLNIYPSLSSYTKKFQNISTKCIAVSCGLFNHLKLSDNSFCIYDGVLPSEERQRLEKENYFLFVGRIEDEKGVFVLLEEYNKYSQMGGSIPLYIVGSGTDGSLHRAKEIIISYKLAHKITLMGFRKDVYDLMSKAKALFVPSIFEGFGFITAEAMYNHCLVVGRNTGGTKEQFDNGLKITGKEIGIRFDSDNELSSIMLSIEEKDFSAVEDLAYDVVRNLYTKEASADKIFQVYSNLLIER